MKKMCDHLLSASATEKMFEYEDMSSNFHETFLNKYAESSGPILDFYISDSMQDMLDIDIRTEVATVVGGTNEFTSLINDLPSLDIESSSSEREISWLGGPKWTGANDLYADVGACVNPNSVMPIITSSLLNASKANQVNLNTTHYRPSSSPPPSPKENKSHLTFSPQQIKVQPVQERRWPSQLATTSKPAAVEAAKKELIADFKEDAQMPKKVSSNTILPTGNLPTANTIKLAPGIGGLTFANSVSYTKLKQTPLKTSPAPAVFSSNIVLKNNKESSPFRHINSSSVTNGGALASNNTKVLSRGILMQSKNVPASGQPQMNGLQAGHGTHGIKSKGKLVGEEYPKPAYSYSCLIAMALKNSRSGSLPVSEIYSFICEHFPFFKTAHSGWKNSVRHNLSLNKCFEKIEKPATNGAQRKGCLWAMHPAKIAKMDEEVQKWSRKDPMAIRKAMVHPENLEALERGEMKHGSTGDSDGENDVQSDLEDNSDSEEQENDIDENLDVQESLDEEDEEQEREFDVEVTDFYDAIDVEDNKDTIRMTIQRNDLLEYTENDYQSPKRARLDVNYSIGPAGAFQHQIQQQQRNQHPHQQTHHSRRKMQLVNRII